MMPNDISPANLLALRQSVKAAKPLIHCITNPLSINDCANIVLAAGAKPIMAEHPAEVARITAMAGALAVNLGNITDVRLESMLLAGKTAKHASIPSIIDLVGVACSDLRLNFSRTFLRECSPSVIKGNISELKAFCGLKNHAKGIDAGEQDSVNSDSLAGNMAMLKDLAQRTGAVVAATGAIDIITDGREACCLENGSEMLSLITGTGCMLNVLTATFISTRDILNGTILATAVMGICGELASQAKGPGSFRSELLDAVFTLSDQTFNEKIRITR